MSTRTVDSIPSSDDQAGWKEYAQAHPFYVALAAGTPTDYSRSDALIDEVQDFQAPDDDERAGYGQVKDLVFVLLVVLPCIILALYLHPWG